MKSFRLHRPKKGFQAIYKRKLTWKEKISKFWNKVIFTPLKMASFFLLIITLGYLTPHTSSRDTFAERLRDLVDFIKSFF